MECPTTGKVRKERIPGVLFERRYMEALADEIGRYADKTSVLESSRHYHVDYKTALAFEKAYLTRKKSLIPPATPTRIGIDEIYLGAMGYRIVVSDLDAGYPIWVGGENRKTESLELFFAWLGIAGCNKIQLAVMDMWNAYVAALKKHCPNADIVYDKFHVVAKIQEAMDTDEAPYPGKRYHHPI